MKTNTIKQLITIVAVAITISMNAGSVYAGDNGNGTITDSAGLVWLKNANCFGVQNWAAATASAAGLQSGMCGLTDKSKSGQWRLPTKDELLRIYQNQSGFNDVQVNLYWSSSTYVTDTAWIVFMLNGYVDVSYKNYNNCVWPVRAGH